MKHENKEQNLIYLKVIIGIAFLSICIVFGFYKYYFNGQITSSHELWGLFGDYVGGTLNPIFSFLALIALLITIVIQSKQLSLSAKELELTREELKKTSDASLRQAEYFENEAKRTDIYRIIDKLSIRINKNFNEDRIDPLPNTSRHLSVHSAMKKGDDLNTNKELRNLYDKYQNVNTNSYQIMKWLENDLERLSNYIIIYEEATGLEKSQTPLHKFYRDEFGDMVSVFYRLSMINEKVYRFYCDC